MIYTAYLDDSDTHGDNPTIIMTGVLGFEHQLKQSFQARKDERMIE
jgi:hypothetical protein